MGMPNGTGEFPPPSGTRARVLTLASPLLPILLPLAWFFQRQAFREADRDSRFTWARRWWNRPVVFAVVAWAALSGVGFLLIVIPTALGGSL
jgi:hypothetical protein